jgi:hypothetical protein
MIGAMRQVARQVRTMVENRRPGSPPCRERARREMTMAISARGTMFSPVYLAVLQPYQSRAERVAPMNLPTKARPIRTCAGTNAGLSVFKRIFQPMPIGRA